MRWRLLPIAIDYCHSYLPIRRSHLHLLPPGELHATLRGLAAACLRALQQPQQEKAKDGELLADDSGGARARAQALVDALAAAIATPTPPPVPEPEDAPSQHRDAASLQAALRPLAALVAECGDGDAAAGAAAAAPAVGRREEAAAVLRAARAVAAAAGVAEWPPGGAAGGGGSGGGGRPGAGNPLLAPAARGGTSAPRSPPPPPSLPQAVAAAVGRWRAEHGLPPKPE